MDKDGAGSHMPYDTKPLRGTIPEPFWCDHTGMIDGEQVVIEVYRNDSPTPNYYKCRVCGDEFPVIGDTDRWYPVPVDYDKQT